MLKYGAFVYSVLYFIENIIQYSNENILGPSILLIVSILYFFLNLLNDNDDFFIFTPIFVFASSFTDNTFGSVVIIGVPLLEFLFMLWYHVFRKNNECNDSFIADCRKSVILSSSLIVISVSKLMDGLEQEILISSLGLVICMVIFIYVHMDICFKMTRRRYNLTSNDEQEELFDINDSMI